jgi:magnesium chelatase family protein
LTFPAGFTLVGAMNPCPCGYLGDPVRECRCAPQMIQRYQKRIRTQITLLVVALDRP